MDSHAMRTRFLMAIKTTAQRLKSINSNPTENFEFKKSLLFIAGNQASRGVKGAAAAEGVPALKDQATGFLDKIQSKRIWNLFFQF